MAGRRANGEGSIYFTAQGLWRANWSLPNGKRQYASGKTRAEAIANRNRKRAAYEQGLRSRKGLTLAQLCDDWLETIAVGRRPRTWEEYHSVAENHVKPYLGDVKVADLEPQHLRDLYYKRLRKLAPATIMKVHSVLRGALKMALTDRLIPYSVAALVTPPKVPEYEARELSVAEVARILVAVQGHRHGPIWAFLIGTGCRWGEAAGLTWAAVDEQGQAVRVRIGHSRLPSRFRILGGPGWELADLKTRRSKRGIHLSGLVADALEEQAGQVARLRDAAGSRWKEHDLVFPNSIGGPLRNDRVLLQWHEVMRGIGLEVPGGQPIRHHDLRRALATLVQDVGAGEVGQVRDILGHSTIATSSDVYTGRLVDSTRRTLDLYAETLARAIRAAS